MDTSRTTVADRPLLERRNPLGVASVVVGGVAVLLGATLGIAVQASLGSLDITTVGVLSAVSGIVTGLLGLAALVLGIVAVVLPRRGGRALAAAGLAIGAVLVFQALLGLLTPLLLNAR